MMPTGLHFPQIRRWIALLLIIIFLQGCSVFGVSEQVAAPPAQRPETQPEEQAGVVTPVNVPAQAATPTALLPAATEPALLPTTTFTAAPSPTPTLFPMSIEAMRLREYPGSEITIEQELDAGVNYRRFYASYLSEGLRIYALLTVPNGEMPADGWPAVVFNHGYIPPSVYRTTERYVAYVDGFARSGYIVFRIDYRGHDRSEGQASGAYGDPGYTVDVLNAVASIKSFPQADPNRIGMWGHSMGGYLTLRAMVISQDVKVGVIWGGVVASYPDLLTRWRRNSTGPTPTAPAFARRWRTAWVEQFGTPEQNPEFWRSVSSNSYLEEISGPIQMHHADTDETVPVVFSELLSAEMQAAGQPVELYIYPGDNHNLSNYFSTAMQRSVEFFDRYLK